MLHEPKPLASLSSGLLARKGGAKPAMRRPNLVQAELGAPMDDDLGWNDMGYDVNPSHSSGSDDIVTHFQQNPLKNAIPEALPAVRQQQDAIAERLRAEPVAEPVAEPAATVTAIAPERTPDAALELLPPIRAVAAPQDPPVERASDDRGLRKAAFTLRLDADRHLRLRLASTIENLSAQRLVTKAVDEYLKSIPELDDLTQRMPLRQAR